MTAFPTLLTLFIAGVWHGAGLKYMVYGLLHGVYITVNHAWRTFGPQEKIARLKKTGGRAAVLGMQVWAVLLTFVAVLVSQAFFRGNDCRQALSIVAGMTGLHGLGSPYIPGEIHAIRNLDILQILPGLCIVWFLPNTQQLLSRFHPALGLTAWDAEPSPRRWFWAPNVAWAVGLSCLLCAALAHLEDPSTFLYFQF